MKMEACRFNPNSFLPFIHGKTIINIILSLPVDFFVGENKMKGNILNETIAYLIPIDICQVIVQKT
jgi:hypothetical protein